MVKRGAAAVEAALVLALVLALVFGIIEFGRALMVQQVMTEASRNAARRAVIPNVTQSVVEGEVTSLLTSAGISGYTQEIHVNGTQANLSTASAGDTITVRLVVPYSQVSWGVFGFINGSRQFVTEVEMRKE